MSYTDLRHRRLVATVLVCLGLLGFAGAITTHGQSTASASENRGIAIENQAVAVSAADGSGCAEFRFCSWSQRLYRGVKNVIEPCVGVVNVGAQWSAKNNCRKDVRLLLSEGGSTTGVACMNPGGQRPDPGKFNRVDSSDVICQ